MKTKGDKMKLRVAELDGGEFFHGTAFDDNGKELFDVELIEWLSGGTEKCIVKSYQDGKVYKVLGDWTMEEVQISEQNQI